MVNGELNCNELVELVTEYLEGTLPAGERTRLEAHLADCSKCGIYLEQMRQTIRALGKLTEDSIPTPAREELLQAFRAWKQGSSLGTRL